MVTLDADMRSSDKVLLIAGPHAGERARLRTVFEEDSVLLCLEGTGQALKVKATEIRNLSAAARKAWQTRPTRRVGRPRGKILKRTSVTLRIDESLWNQFREMELAGRIKSRSQFVESLLRDGLTHLPKAGQ